MLRTIKAKYIDGVLVPLEPVSFKEGDEIPISFDDAYNLSPEERDKISMSAAGGWVGDGDADKLIREIYTSRHRGFSCDCIYCAPEG